MVHSVASAYFVTMKMNKNFLDYAIVGAMGIPSALFLSVVWGGVSSLPANVLEDDWRWMYACGVVSLGMLAWLVFRFPFRMKRWMPITLSWVLILYGGIEAAWGIRQVYGLAHSNHSLYALTGSFYNPGPYSGYLAMVFPVCLYEWLRRKEGRKTMLYYMALSVLALVLCVLPAGMSRSAWIAAAVSSAYICTMCYGARIRMYVRQHRRRTLCMAVAALLSAGMALGGIYLMKKDSADGRLFLWKMSARAVCEHPWTGVGWSGVPAAYGQAQEAYFAAGDYTPAEERVAGSPEYVFNEYLQVAVAWGLPVLCAGLLVVGGSFYIGHRQGMYGLCGALLSLAVFAFSSYPLQFPAFVSALVMLVLVCVVHVLPVEKVGFRWLLLAVLLVGSGVCYKNFQQKDRMTEACRKWVKSRMLYQTGAYGPAVESYAGIEEALKGNARFLFEYGHALHKLHEPERSNRVLKEALKVSGDPMILNIIGKNEQEMKHYECAEYWLLRASHRLPGRIYPYYLLAKLYAEPGFYQRDKLERMVRLVCEKEPKVQSTAIRQMRQQARELLKASDN